jgi:hypothetical protein
MIFLCCDFEHAVCRTEFEHRGRKKNMDLFPQHLQKIVETLETRRRYIREEKASATRRYISHIR